MSELTRIAEIERAKQLATNDYTENKPYSSSHPDAISDGDERGKEGVGNNVGSKTDIACRTQQLAKNKYSANNEYGLGSL